MAYREGLARPTSHTPMVTPCPTASRFGPARITTTPISRPPQSQRTTKPDPVEQLDLAATQKANLDAGEEFQLPTVRQ